MKIGLFPMVADVIHAGHILAIKEAKQNCDYLIVALYCKPKRKPGIVQSIFERYIQLDAIKYVDEVIPYEDEEDTNRLILSLDFDIYFLGADYRGKDFEGKDLLTSLDKELFYLSRNHTMSSTQLKLDIFNRIQLKKRPVLSAPKIIAVDFDGCICTEMWPDIGEPNWDVIHALQKEHESGTKLILWTCRCDNHLEEALNACKSWGLTFDAVNENIPERVEQYGGTAPRKVSADEYWDDRGIKVVAHI